MGNEIIRSTISNLEPTQTPQPQNPKHKSQWHFIHWRFVRGFMTIYPMSTAILWHLCHCSSLSIFQKSIYAFYNKTMQGALLKSKLADAAVRYFPFISITCKKPGNIKIARRKLERQDIPVKKLGQRHYIVELRLTMLVLTHLSSMRWGCSVLVC